MNKKTITLYVAGFVVMALAIFGLYKFGIGEKTPVVVKNDPLNITYKNIINFINVIYGNYKYYLCFINYCILY